MAREIAKIWWYKRSDSINVWVESAKVEEWSRVEQLEPVFLNEKAPPAVWTGDALGDVGGVYVFVFFRTRGPDYTNLSAQEDEANASGLALNTKPMLRI